VREIKVRTSNLSPQSQRQWGKMTPAQAMAHCAGGMETRDQRAVLMYKHLNHHLRSLEFKAG
jgi:hypothetical protein